MSSLAPETRRSPLATLRWALTDVWTLAARTLIHWLRNPAMILWGLMMPIASVLLFGFVFGSAMSVYGGGSYKDFLLPGMFGQTMMFGIAATIGAVATDTARGITDRFRTMPMSQSAVVGGRCLADMLNSVLDLTVLVAAGLAIGWRWHGSPDETLLAFGLLLLLRFGFLWVGIYIGLMVNEEGAAAAWGPLYPLSMLSNAFVSPELMPGWLQPVAEWNPLSATITATRDLFDNPGTAGGSWVTQNAMLMAVVWPLVLFAIFFPLSVRRYRRLSR